MIVTKTLLLMVMGLAGRENGGKAKNHDCRVLRRVLAQNPGSSPGMSPGSVYKHPRQVMVIHMFNKA